MKLLLSACVAICFAGAYCDTAPKPSDIKYVKDCATKNGLDDKVIADLKNSKSVNLSEATKCFAHCVLKHNELIDDEGKLTDKFKGSPKLASCKNPSGNGKCEIAANALDCMLKAEGATLKDLNL